MHRNKRRTQPPWLKRHGGTLAVLLFVASVGPMFYDKQGTTVRQTSVHPAILTSVPQVSSVAVSSHLEREIGTTLASFVPQLTDVYIKVLSDKGVAIFATGSLNGYPVTKAMCDQIASQFLVATYKDLPKIRVDFASLYLAADGRYVFAAGLGRHTAESLAIAAYAPDQGDALSQALAQVDQYSAPLEEQAYSQFNL